MGLQDTSDVRRSALTEGPWLAVVVCVAALHLRFLLVDTRLPGDRGLMFQELSRAQAALGDAALLPHVLTSVTGWYQLALALALKVLGPSPELVQAPGLIWSTLLVLSTALVARKLAGPTAATLAAALVGVQPLAVDMGRILWFHVPEAALVVSALAVFVHDPELTRWRSVVAVSVLGVLALTLRHTGLVWVATLLPCLWPARRGRAWVVVLSWGLAALVPLSGFVGYLELKAQAVDRYGDLVPGIAVQLGETVGWIPIAVSVVGIGLAARARTPAPWLTFAAWLVGPLALVGVFSAGIDNHTLFAPGLAIAGALGLSRVPRAPAVAAAGFFLFHALGQLGLRADAEPIYSMERPYSEFGEPELRALFEATCPEGGRRSCRILTDKGLFRPYSTSRGELEFLTLGEDRVRVLPARLTPEAVVRQAPVHALARMVCEPSPRGESWSRGEPSGEATVLAAIEAHGLAVAWERELSPGCVLAWWTPDGHLRAPAP